MSIANFNYSNEVCLMWELKTIPIVAGAIFSTELDVNWPQK